MPYLAISEDELVLPHQVTNSDSFYCPRCEKEMNVVPSHRSGGTFVATYFRHDSGTECPGESSEHARMKSIAYSKLDEEYPGSKIMFEETRKGKDGIHRQADVLVEFPSPRYPYGKGIAAEVQYRNYTKDLQATERDYYDLGYSVLWLYEQHYSDNGKDVDVGHVRPIWPNGVLHQNDPAPTLDDFSEDGEQPSIEIEVPFPPDFYESIESTLREAFEKGQEEIPVDTGANAQNQSASEGADELSFEDFRKVRTEFDPYEKVWLSRPSDTLNRSLNLVTASVGRYGLQLCKGQTGESPETLKIPLTLSAARRLPEIATAVESNDSIPQTSGEWDEILTLSLETDANTSKDIITLSTPPGNDGVVIQFEREWGHQSPNRLATKFQSSNSRVQNLTRFFKKVEQRLEDDS